MGEATGIEGLVPVLADHDLDAAGVQHRALPEVLPGAGAHRAGNGELAVGDALHGTGNFEWTAALVDLREVRVAAESQRDLGTDTCFDHLRDRFLVPERSGADIVETLLDHLL